MLALAGSDCAIPLDVVVEVLARPQVTPVPHSPPAFRGLAVVRGDIVGVQDLGLLLGSASTWGPHAVLVRSRAGLATLVVDALPEAATVVDEGTEDGAGRGGNGERRVRVRLGEVGSLRFLRGREAVVPLLDVAALLGRAVVSG